MTTPFYATTQGAFERNEPLLTTQQLKERYLVGLVNKDNKLVDFQGNEIPDATIDYHIRAALSYLEHKLDLIIIPTNFTEEYDYRAVDYMNFNFIQLKKRPLIDVTVLKARFPNHQDLVVYPKDWYVLEKEASQVQLSPIEGTFSGLIVTQGGSYVPLIYGVRDSWPHLFQVQYTAGFCSDQIPVIINEMIGMQACIRIFEILGDVLFGPGVISEGVSLDGAGVNRALANSQKYALFSGRITSYKEQMKDYIDSVKKFYNGFASVVA